MFNAASSHRALRQRAYSREYYAANREHILKNSSNDELVRARRKAYYWKNRDKRLAYGKEYNSKHREERLAYARAYAKNRKKNLSLEDKERLKEKARAYYAKKKERREIESCKRKVDTRLASFGIILH